MAREDVRAMANLLPHLLERTFASRALDVVKMKGLTPCEVSDDLTKYRATIAEVVYDPLRIPAVNEQFRAAGYDVRDDDDVQVIAVNDDGSILLWGGLNSVYHLRKGEKIGGAFDEGHLAFYDIVDLTGRFRIKNKRADIDELIQQLRETYPAD